MLKSHEAAVLLRDEGLDVPMPTGELAYFNYYWLRDNCPSSFDPQTRERTFDIFAEPSAPLASSAFVEEGCLSIVWQGSHHISRYPLDLLAQYADCGKRPDPANLPRIPWYGEDSRVLTRFCYFNLIEDTGEVKKLARTILQDGIALITDLPDTDRALLDTAGMLGHVRPSYFGLVFEVKTHIKPTNLAFTSAALELHTDLPSEDFAPGIQYLHCRANTVAGGDSLFADGLAVAEDFRRLYPDDFDLLVSTDVPYYCEHDTFDMRARQRVIELDEHGHISGVTISQHQADVFDLPQHQLDAYYPAFCRFGRMMQGNKYLKRFRLNAGDCIAFDNHRIVHGRDAYSATSGERHLRGCYTDRGELRSTYRVLAGKGRFT